MLVARPKSKIVERIIRTREGDFVRAFFAVTEYQGKYFVKLVRTEKIAVRDFNTPEKYFLSGKCQTSGWTVQEIFTESIISPYKDFAFFISQQTRAPSRSL